jgi:uncharacterized protein (TIGR02757 family)
MRADKLKEFLDRKVDEHNQPSFIKDDPISIPHRFSKKQDIEIAGFFASIFAWGNRVTIINKSSELMKLMGMSPHEFVLNPSKKLLKKMEGFKHRTFNDADLYYFIDFFHHHYIKHQSLESAFSRGIGKNDDNIENALVYFKNYFFSQEHLKRTEKHISSPAQKSSCKRLSMFLRWMVRRDSNGVDFGIWRTFRPSQLVCPVDLHVARVSRHFGLLRRKNTDWLAAVELTEHLKRFDPNDPVKYDYALFSLGAMEKF